MAVFNLVSDYAPMGDQPEAIRQLTEGVLAGDKAQTLLGVTGSGKTFTMANVIQNVGRPTLILSHNKTLAAQLYTEFKAFFPDNAVEYYVSYYDYYQPEAYIASTDTYIEKDLDINEEIDMMRLAATSALLSGRRDVIVISSVSCIYGMGNPGAFYENVIELKVGAFLARNTLLHKLVSSLYVRDDIAPKRGNFCVKGDTVHIYLAYSDEVIRVSFWDDTIDAIDEVNPATGKKIGSFKDYKIYPANLFVTSQEDISRALHDIALDLEVREQELRDKGCDFEANRLHERVTYDMEMIRELGHCSGIENYSRYFDGRAPGTRPYCLLDFFPDDYLTIIDESHVTVPQIGGMYGGDRSRKESLVQYGFRLPAALDNRPLRFDEFTEMTNQTIYVSATPAAYELEQSGGVVVEQIIRPTGLLDPEIFIRPSVSQLDDLMEELHKCIENDERALVTTLTKRSAEDLTAYLTECGLHTNYIHSDVDTIDRVRILNDLRRGIIQVLVGVNLLREGLDLPEVSLVAILDADKEGFLRNNRSLTQTAGRAARNVNGRVIMYADRITESIRKTYNETLRRREKQQAYNEAHGITPTQIRKEISSEFDNAASSTRQYDSTPQQYAMAGEPTAIYNSPAKSSILEGETVESLRKKMKRAAEEMDFVAAAQYRDAMLLLEQM